MIAKQHSESKLASYTYRIFFPVTLFALTPWVIAIMEGYSIYELMYPTSILMGIVMLPSWFLYRLILQNTEHKQQVWITCLIGCVLLVCATLLLRNSEPQMIMECIYAGLTACIACTAIHLFKPISPHVAVLAGCGIVAVLSNVTAGAIILPLVLLSNWSTLATNKATLGETVRTWSIVSLSVVFVFMLFELF